MAQETQNRRDALAELARDDSTRSHTAQIRELYDVIEHALNSGVSRTALHQKLVDTGLTISLRHFDQALYRIRKAKKQAGESKASPPQNAQVTPNIKPALLNGDRAKPQANFRQSLKQIREGVENTDWASVINDNN
jgi:hypothetical protein